jgi:hypothetical protein
LGFVAAGVVAFLQLEQARVEAIAAAPHARVEGIPGEPGMRNAPRPMEV